MYVYFGSAAKSLADLASGNIAAGWDGKSSSLLVWQPPSSSQSSSPDWREGR